MTAEGATRCKVTGCGAAIIWAMTEPGGKPMPVDADSAGAEGGTLAVWRAGGRPNAVLFCRVLPPGEDPDPGRGEHRGTAHWATCTHPDAARPKLCPECGHKRHTEPCTKLGPVECRQLGDGQGSMRGRFRCGCEVTDPAGVMAS